MAINLNSDDITNYILGLGGIGLAARYAITWMKRQGLADAGVDSQKQLIADLRTEAKKWEVLYNKEVNDHTEARKQYDATIELLGEVRNQNKMLRLLLIQRGMSAEELDAALEISEGASNG